MSTATELTESKAEASKLSLNFYSHATLECRDIKETRRFFEEFLGFQTVQMADVSFWARMGGNQVIVVVQGRKSAGGKMPFLNHNGLDVANEVEVDAAHRIVTREAEKWELRNISKPMMQHGTYCFYFWDRDDNAWEICANPPGGYSWGFERGDQVGRGHNDPKFARPASTLRNANEGAE